MYISRGEMDISRSFEHENHAFLQDKTFFSFFLKWHSIDKITQILYIDWLLLITQCTMANKADLLKCLETFRSLSSPEVGVKLLDWAALVHSLEPKNAASAVTSLKD